MLNSFLTFINQHRIDLKNEPALLTVSGGVDSVVMAHLFREAGFPAGIAHCNFGLRGEESDEDEVFVKALAERLGFPFYVKRFEVKTFAHARSVSTQMAARELRYQWFDEVREQHGYHWIATAHHANDSLETTLMNLARGTGIAGLQGISGVQNKLIRPLLLASRQEIAAYAAEHRIVWREDSSNQSDDYRRNLVRHHVVPVLQQLNPSLEKTFSQSSERIRAAHALLREYMEVWQAEAVRRLGENIHISKEALRTSSEPVLRLWSVLEAYGFAYGQMAAIIAGLDGISGKTFLSPTHTLLIDREELVVRPAAQSIPDQVVIAANQHKAAWQDWEISITYMHDRYDPDTANGLDVIVVDASQLRFPLTIRRWEQGDRFCPFGMQGRHKKVSDLLTDAKVNRFDKDGVGVLVNGDGKIISVLGFRSDERFRVGDDVKNIAFIRFTKLL